MRLCKLNAVGIERFGQFRASYNSGANPAELKGLLEDAACSEEVHPHIEVEAQQLSTRFAVGEYLNTLFSSEAVPGLDVDRGIWAWLAAFHFELLCPSGTQPGSEERWIPAVGDFRKYYRHLLAGPYQVYRAHRDNPQRAMALLATPPHAPGDVYEQLAARQELVTNPAVMEVATRLYVHPATDALKSGAASREGGSARRLAAFLDQLTLTWDLYALTPEQLLDLLPAEFDRFQR